MARSNLTSILRVPLPGVQRFRTYQRDWLRGDLLAGLTVAAYLIPQCMAYGELAGVAPVAGLWAILPPMVIYTLLGSSPQLSVGPESTTAVMTAAAIAPLAATDGSDYAALASLSALIMSLICIVGYVARLGFLADLLSKPILVGYMAGVAVLMISGQLSKVSGIPIDADTVIGEFQGFFSHLTQVHWPTLSLATFVLLFLGAVQSRFPRAPGPLIAVLLTTAAVALFQLDQRGLLLWEPFQQGYPSSPCLWWPPIKSHP